MRLLSFVTRESPRQIRLGAFVNDCVIDLSAARTWSQGACGLPAEDLPASLPELLHNEGRAAEYTKLILGCLANQNPSDLKGAQRQRVGYQIDEIALLPPLLHPTSIRFFDTFEAHIRAKADLLPKPNPQEWKQTPFYSYGNPNVMVGPDAEISIPRFCSQLDFQTEVACVIGKYGRNISADKAQMYIFGYSLLISWISRDVEFSELAAGFSHGRSSDFAISMGPYLVTPDELEESAVNQTEVYDLPLTTRINDIETGSGNWKSMVHSFGSLIARASIGTYLVPGDVFTSGAFPGGSMLETTGGKGPWLMAGDRVEIEAVKLGTLRNTIGKNETA